MKPPLEKNKNAGSKNGADFVIVLIIGVVMGLAGLATAGLIIYEMARMFFRFAFDVELPNPFE